MASTVLVKLPTVPFPQGKKSPSDIVVLTERNEGLNQNVRHQTINIDRVAQLEQNMKFLQEQHQVTLVALHQEVESLRQKNRDLQFQLVFSKGSTYVPSSPSSPEDNGTGFVKPKGSPVCVNITPLQVELLEKELQDTKISLQETKTQNQHLSEIVEEQKKKLNSEAEEQKLSKQSTMDVGIQVGDRTEPVRADLVMCLEDAEAMIKRLRKQNEEQKEEINTLKAASVNTNTNKGARSRDSNSSHHSRGSPTSTSQEQTPHIFPPLQSQRHWHHRALRNGRNRHYKSMEMDSLPQLQNGNAKQDGMVFESMCYRSRGHRNYYREEGNQKYRGKGSQADHRDSDNNHQHQHHHNNHHHHHRRDYKDRNSKNHQKESAEGLRETDNSAGHKS